MNVIEKRIEQVKRVNDVALFVVLLVGALLCAYLAVGFGTMVVEWFDYIQALAL